MPSLFSVLFRASAHHPLNRRLFLLAVLLFFFQSVASANELPWVEHSVLRGETADSIAAKYAVSSKTVERANELAARTEPLKTGEKLLVPKKESDLLSPSPRSAPGGGRITAQFDHEEQSKGFSSRAEEEPLPRPAEPSSVRSPEESPLPTECGRTPARRRGYPGSQGNADRRVAPGKVVFSGTIQGFGRTVPSTTATG